MSDGQKDRWALLRALWLLWCVGVTVGLSIAGEWIALMWFSLGVVFAHGASALVLEITDKRKER